jgi:hypothetical protein
MPVIVNYQISGEPHQPIRQIALFGVVLFERAVNPYKYFLSQILSRFDARRETKSEIKNPPRKLRDNLFPSRPVACPAPPDKFRSVTGRHYCF